MEPPFLSRSSCNRTLRNRTLHAHSHPYMDSFPTIPFIHLWRRLKRGVLALGKVGSFFSMEGASESFFVRPNNLGRLTAIQSFKVKGESWRRFRRDLFPIFDKKRIKKTKKGLFLVFLHFLGMNFSYFLYQNYFFRKIEKLLVSTRY